MGSRVVRTGDCRMRRQDDCAISTGRASVVEPPRDRSATRMLCRMSLRQLLLTSVAPITLLTACAESPVQTLPVHDPEESARLSVGPPVGVSRPAADEAPVGVGGSYTMTAGGEKITGLPMAGTGIRLPNGVPVRVRVSGAITRTATAGLLEFCALPRWASSCQGVWADIVAEDPIPPSGPSFWPGAGAALVAWDGGAGLPPSEGSRIAYAGGSGSELWAGRSEWGCYYFDSQEIQGPCFAFGGAYTVTVEADDGGTPNDTASAGGSGGGSQDAQLTALATLAGGTVYLSATTDDGSAVGSPSWVFTPDEVRTVNGDTTAPATPAPARSPSSASGALPSGGRVNQMAQGRLRLPDGRVVGPGLYVWAVQKPATTFGATPRSALASGPHTVASPISAAPQPLSECDYLAECAVSDPGASGTYVIVADVHGSTLSASARIREGGTAQLSLACTTPVTRGEDTACQASVSGPGASLEITGWGFVPDQPSTLRSVTRDDDVSSAQWTGRMAASGTVAVMGLAGVTPDTATFHVEVLARDWSGQVIGLNLSQDSPGTLPEHPKNERELGGTLVGIDFDATTLLPALETVSDGPNKGYQYFNAIPFRAGATVSINTRALGTDTDFYRLQEPRRRTINGVLYCSRADVVSVYLPLVQIHEGIHGRSDTKSHVAIYADRLEREAQARVESMVSSESFPDFAAARAEMHSIAGADSDAMDTDGRNPAQAPCTMHYFK